MRRNFVYVSACLMGAYALDAGLDTGLDAAWERHNAGRLYHHALARGVVGRPAEDEDDE